MDLKKVLSELHKELNDLDAAIMSLERLQHEGRRRGRPPKVLEEIRNSLKIGHKTTPQARRPAVGGGQSHE